MLLLAIWYRWQGQRRNKSSVEAEVVATAKAKAAAAEAKAVMAAAAEAVMAAKAEAVMSAAAEAAAAARAAAAEVRAAAERAIEERAEKDAEAKAMEAVLGVAVPGDSTLGNYPPSSRDRGHAEAPLTDSHASQGKSDSRRQAYAAQGEPPRRAHHQHARSPDRTMHASRHSPEGRGGGRRSAEDDEERRWLAKLEQREGRQHSGTRSRWSSASRLAAQTLVALNAIQQHVDSLGLVAVFDSIDANHTGEVSASQLARALMRMGVHMDGEVEARLLSKQIIRAVNQRHGSTLRILAFDIFCHLFGQRGALHIGEPFTEAPRPIRPHRPPLTARPRPVTTWVAGRRHPPSPSAHPSNSR